MIFTELKLKGAYLIDMEPVQDNRGAFTRTFCRDEFERHGLNPSIAQCSVSHNLKRRTLRGMHYQVSPRQEAKLVRCISGTIYDVIIDLREDSSTCGQWEGVELTATGARMLYVPEGFAHGFETLEDNTDVFYQISAPYSAELARGVRWDDPAFGIAWPETPLIMSERDRSYPDFEMSKHA